MTRSFIPNFRVNINCRFSRRRLNNGIPGLIHPFFSVYKQYTYQQMKPNCIHFENKSEAGI